MSSIFPTSGIPSAPSTRATFMPSGRETTAADQHALLDNLTDDDWGLMAAATGKTLDKSSQLQPLMLWQIALDRGNGRLERVS